MEFNGLTFDKFNYYLHQIEDLWILNDKIAHDLFQYGKKYGDYSEFYFPTMATAVVDLLMTLLDDRHEWIAYWCFERDFGKRTDMGTVTGEDGTIYPLETPEHLWNLLAAERRERGEQ